MKKKIVWAVASGLMVLALLVTSCAKAEEKAPVVKEAAPVVKEAAPAVKEAAPAAGAEMLKVTLTKKDGTKMEKLVEKPRYGGTLFYTSDYAVIAWDEAFQAPWMLGPYMTQTNEDLLMANWALGLGGTEEMTWQYGSASWFLPENAPSGLAESWEHPEPGTLVFHIRKGVKWALNPNSAASRLVNGREFTADDVVFNIKRIYFDILTSTMYGMLGVSRPTEVYATDKYTVVLKAPEATIGDTLENITIMTRMVPPEVVKKYGDMNAWENVVGTGPFMLTDYVAMSSVTWVRNPNYWMTDPILGKDYPLPYLDGLKYLLIPDLSTRMAALRTGKVETDYYRYPLEYFEQLIKYNPDLKYSREEPTSMSLPGGRVDKPELPFKDIRVRRALMLAINQQEIADTYYKGDANVLLYKMPPIPELIALGWHTPLKDLPPETRELYTYNPEKAKQLLAEAGYPNGFKTEVVLPANRIEYIDQATMYKAYWAKIGVDLTLDIKELGVQQSIYMRKAHKEMLWWGRGGMYTSMYLVRRGNMFNWAMVDDPKIDDYYYPGVQAAFFDPPKKNKLMREMNQYVLSKVWYYAGPGGYGYRVWQPWLKGYHGENGPLSLYCATQFMQYVWLDQELKKSMGY